MKHDDDGRTYPAIDRAKRMFQQRQKYSPARPCDFLECLFDQLEAQKVLDLSHLGQELGERWKDTCVEYEEIVEMLQAPIINPPSLVEKEELEIETKDMATMTVGLPSTVDRESQTQDHHRALSVHCIQLAFRRYLYHELYPRGLGQFLKARRLHQRANDAESLYFAKWKQKTQDRRSRRLEWARRLEWDPFLFHSTTRPPLGKLRSRDGTFVMAKAYYHWRVRARVWSRWLRSRRRPTGLERVWGY